MPKKTKWLYCRGMLSQAKNLVKRMTADKTIDVKNDWKLVTIFIGGNDACAYCKNEVSSVY